jgi:hypothetical protein
MWPIDRYRRATTVSQRGVMGHKSTMMSAPLTDRLPKGRFQRRSVVRPPIPDRARHPAVIPVKAAVEVLLPPDEHSQQHFGQFQTLPVTPGIVLMPL